LAAFTVVVAMSGIAPAAASPSSGHSTSGPRTELHAAHVPKVSEAKNVPLVVHRASQCAVPGAPGTVAATAGSQSATVTWTAANGNGSAITAYVVRETAGPESGASIGTPAAATQGVLDGLAGGSPATLSVAAVSACGTGPAAAAAPVTPTGSATTYVGSVLSASPSIYYRYGEPVGTTLAADSSGNAGDGQYTGQGVLGQTPALANDPTTSVGYSTCCSGIATSPDTPPQYNSARTVEAWVNTTNALNNPAVVGYGSSSTDQGFVVGIEPSGIYVDGRGDQHLIPTTHTLNDGTWHMLAVTYDGTTVTAYLDGQFMGTTLFNAPLDTLGAGLSTGYASGYNALNGDLQDVAIFPSALTAATVSTQFAAAGYSLPGAVTVLHVSTGGNNAATLTWGLPPGVDTGFLVSVASGPNAGQSVSVPARSTAARLYGLAAASQTFQVQAFNTFGTGPAVTSAAFAVPGSTPTYASTVLADSPSVFYRLGDSTTALMADSSDHGYNGTYSKANVTLGQPGPLPSDPTRTVVVGTVNQGVGTYPGSVLPQYNSPRTIEAWINTTSTSTSPMTMVSWGVNGTNTAMAAYVYPDDVALDGWNDNQEFPTPYPLNDGLWHLVTLTYDGTTITAYLDGLPIGTGHFGSILDTLPSGVNVGWRIDNGYSFYNSSIADVAVYPTALSAARVLAHFTASGYARPAAPGSPAATAGINSATVTWTAPAPSGSPIKDYVVTALLAGKPVASQSVNATGTSTVIGGLKGGSAYTFNIAAVNSYGTGASATTPGVTPTGGASTYASTVLSDKPSVFYRLGDTSTAVMPDSSGHGYNGAYSAANVTQNVAGPLTGDPTTAVTTGQNNQGVGSYAGSVLPLYNSARTVEAWINTTQNSNGMALASWGASGTNTAMAAYVYPNAIALDGYQDNQVLPTPYPIDDGVWHLVALTYDGTTITGYLDGLPIGTAHFASALDTLPGGLAVGLTVWNSNQYYNSSIADVAVYPTALKAARVLAHFTASNLTRPGAPGSPSATAGTNSATVSWSAPTPLPGNPIKDYLVTALLAGKAVNSQSVPTTPTSATINGLQGGSAYTFKITAYNSYGAGTAATTASVTPTGATSTYASTVLSDKPSVFYRLGDSSTALMADSSGHGFSGAYAAANVAQGATGPLAGTPTGADPTTAVTTASNNQGVGSYPGSVLPLYNSARSVEAWINTTQNSNGMTVVSWGTPGTNTAMAVYVYPNDLAIDGYNDNQIFPTPYPINDGVWHQIALTYDGATITAYLDGLPVGTGHFSGALDTLGGGLDVGLTVWNASQYYNSSIADVAVYPTALTGARVLAHFNASNLARPGAPGSPLVSSGSDSAMVSWSAAASGGSPIKDYLVSAVLGGKAVNSESVQATATSATLRGLAGATAYTFQITGFNSYGAGTPATTSAVTIGGNPSTYASNVLTDGPSVFYRLGDSSTASMADSSGNSYNGSYSAANVVQNAGGPLVGEATTAVTTDANGQGVGTYPGSGLPLYNSARTVEAWIDTTQNSNGMTIVSWGSPGTNTAMAAYAYPNAIALDGYNDNQVFATPYAIDDGVWHLVTLTYNGTTITAYLDGLPIGSGHFTAPLDTLPGGLDVGVTVWGAAQYYNSSIADVAVYPTALSAARVLAHFTASGYVRPGAPGAPKVTKGANSVTVSWTAASSPGSAIKDYLVTAMLGSTPVDSQSVPATNLSTTVSGLKGGSAYTFQIAAFNSYGEGSAATTASVTPTGPASTYASLTLSDSPSVYYRLGDTALGLMADSSGHGFNGAYNAGTNEVSLGQPGAITGDPDTSALGNGQYIGTSRASVPLYNSARTVEGWIKTTSGSTQYLAGWGVGGTATAFDLYLGPSSVSVDDSSQTLTFSSPASLDNGSWHFVVATYDGTNLTVYVDGTSLGSQVFTQPLNTQPASSLVVGGYYNGGGGVSGDLDEFAVFPTALTAAQVLAQFTAS
jgi:inosine-uridine nucleoside N-ribohydrolase